jgi:hypothetical protein
MSFLQFGLCIRLAGGENQPLKVGEDACMLSDLFLPPSTNLIMYFDIDWRGIGINYRLGKPSPYELSPFNLHLLTSILSYIKQNTPVKVWIAILISGDDPFAQTSVS